MQMQPRKRDQLYSQEQLPHVGRGELETQEGTLLNEAIGSELWGSTWDRRMVVGIDESEAAPSTHPSHRLHEGSKFVGIFFICWGAAAL